MLLGLKNYQLETIGKVLNYPTSFQVGRAKMRIMKILGEKQSVTNASRLEMLKTLAEVDEKKAPVIENGQYKLSADNLKKFNEEYMTMMGEDCPVDIPESMKNDLATFKQLLHNSPVQIDNRDIVIMEEVVEALAKTDPVAPAAPGPKVQKRSA